MITETIFQVNGNKISTLLISTESFKFSSGSFESVDAFNEGWDKKLTLNTKQEVKFDALKSVQKEDGDNDIKMKFKSLMGLTGELEFSFHSESDVEHFFAILEKDIMLNKTIQKLSPFKAIQGYLFGLIISCGLTAFSYNIALDIQNGVEDLSSGSRKTRAFKNIVGMLGDKGVLLIGVAISLYIAYKIWIRYSNPPMQTRFEPIHR